MAQNGNHNLPTSQCRKGCGFYGSANFDGMCSKCYKDVLKRKQQNPSPVGGRLSPAITETETVSSMAAALAQSSLGSATLGDSQDLPVTNLISSTSTPNPMTTPSVETATTTVLIPGSSQSSDSSEHSEEGAVGGAEIADTQDDDSPNKDKKSQKKRCQSCKKKVGLTGFQCRCGGLYCSIHRYSDKHDCKFDYKEMAQELIRKNNPVIVGEKIQKI